MKILKFKVLLMILGFIAFTITTNAQSRLTANISSARTNFSFKDSQGVKDTSYNASFSQAFHIGYNFMPESGLIIRSSIGLRNAGATMSYDNSNYIWDLQYLDIQVGGGYLYNFGSIGVYFTLTPYFAYLLKGNQVLNNQNFDIKETGSLSNADFGLFITPGFQFNISDNISVFTEFNYMLGLKNLETGEATEQITKNNALSLTAGISLAIGNN